MRKTVLFTAALMSSAAFAQTGEITSAHGENWLSQDGDWGLTFNAQPLLCSTGMGSVDRPEGLFIGEIGKYPGTTNTTAELRYSASGGLNVLRGKCCGIHLDSSNGNRKDTCSAQGDTYVTLSFVGKDSKVAAQAKALTAQRLTV
ncbi:MAG: hypothetical protein IPJ76_05470 [Flavobacteriales bacterium]|nr:MAG: hypothetical protein IPJ76_05470 [Flavobacteriales bacterium]